jgi:four helix bundle protein
MFLQLAHKKLDAYQLTRKLVYLSYKATQHLPPEEKFGMSQQIRRAALSVHLNLSEGCSRKSSMERKRYFEIARGSIVEIDAALDVAKDLEYLSEEKLKELGEYLVRSFQIISKMIS